MWTNRLRRHYPVQPSTLAVPWPPGGQQSPGGVTRPPLVTTQQHTPPPVNPTRTETPEPRSYGEQLRRQAEALRKQVRDLLDANAELWDAVRTRDGRIVRLEGEKANLTQRLEGYIGRVADLEHTVNELALAAHERQQRHERELGAARRPLGDDPEPTGPLAAFAAEQLARQQQQTGWGFIVAEPRVSDDLLATGWLPRSSGGQSAPLVGES